MTIRKKLLVLLLAMALIPLVVISVFHQVSMRVVRQRLTQRIQRTLDANAAVALQEILQSYDEIFQRESRLMEALIRRQAREVELRLAQQQQTLISPEAIGGYGFDEALAELPGARDKLSGQERPEGEDRPQVSYRRQAYFAPEGVEGGVLTADLGRLQGMTAVYHEIYLSGLSGILWQYTSLENGLHLSYPWSDVPHPPTYDPRKRQWYLRAKTSEHPVRVGPLVDAVSGQTIVTVAAAVRRPDGSFAGVTAIDRCIPDILANMKLPFRWAEGAERMLVAPDPQADPCEPKVTVLLQSSYSDTHADWPRQIALERLGSQDANEMRLMVADMGAGTPGVRKLEYKGHSCLWAYGKPNVAGGVPLLIIPYDRVIEMADSASRSLLNESRLLLKVTGIVLLLVGAAIVAIAVVCAQFVTRPILSLTKATEKLAAGDYDVRVNIDTRDELERLGEVFNETGPRLKEQEKMKRSLELAGAIQRSLLPKEPPKLRHFDIAAECLYCDEAGGDYYDFIDMIELGTDRVGIALGDVSGHGIGAALLMAAARSSLRANVRHHGADVVSLFRMVNRDLVRDTGEDKFVTLFYGILNDTDRSLIWASGGHDPAFWCRADTGVIEELPNTGMLMGIFEDAAFEQAGPVHLSSGDVLMVGTDGLWESSDSEGNFFGKERLREVLLNARGSAREICDAFLMAVADFCGPAPRQDDITLVVVKVL